MGICLLMVWFLSSCAMFEFNSRPLETRTFTVTGVDYVKAYEEAREAAVAAGLKIRSLDKAEGKFEAWTHQPFIEVAELFVELKEVDKDRTQVTIRGRSTKSNEALIENFITQYRQSVKIHFATENSELSK